MVNHVLIGIKMTRKAIKIVWPDAQASRDMRETLSNPGHLRDNGVVIAD